MNQATTTSPPRAVTAWRSPWVIAWVAMVVIVLAVNVTMVWLAISTNPGLVRADYYDRGQDLERTIASRIAQTPGWTMSIDTPAEVRTGVPTTVRFFIVDQAGQPVRPEQVAYFAYRPSDATRDFTLPMQEEAPGRYAASVVFPLAGVWDTLVRARRGDAEHGLDQRISVATD